MRFPIGDADVVCIDWDERSMRIVEASATRGGLKVRSAVEAPFASEEAPRDPAALGDFLRRTLGEHRIRARRAILAVPRQEVVLNLMTLPRGTQDELAAMIHIQIAKELPFAKDQTVIDFAVSPGTDAGNVDVWVAAVRNQVVDHYRQVITAAGLRPDRVGLRPYANLSAMNALVEPAGRTLLVDIGPSLTEIDVLRDGRLAYSRAATVGIPPEGLSLVVMDSLLVEVNRTIGAYRSTDHDAKIDRIVLAGSVGIDDAVVQAFKARFGVPTQVFSVPASLKWRGASGSVAPFSAAVGMALGTVLDDLRSFNLLAAKEPETERRERIRRVPYRAAVAIALAAVTVAAAYVPIHKKKSEIALLNDRIATLNQDKAARDELKNFETTLRDWEGANVRWIDHLRLIADAFPRTEKAYISKADFKENKEIQLEMQALDKFQAEEVADSVGRIRERGRPLYSPRLGIASDATGNDPKYRITDHMVIQIKASPTTRPAASARPPAAGETSGPEQSESKTPTTMPTARRRPAGA